MIEIILNREIYIINNLFKYWVVQQLFSTKAANQTFFHFFRWHAAIVDFLLSHHLHCHFHHSTWAAQRGVLYGIERWSWGGCTASGRFPWRRHGFLGTREDSVGSEGFNFNGLPVWRGRFKVNYQGLHYTCFVERALYTFMFCCE